MTTFAVDVSCMIAVVSVWDKRHAEASAELEVRLARGERISISVQALTEAYSVLTRMPPPYRLSTAQAWEVLQAMFLSQSTLISLDAAAQVALVQTLAQQDIGGGRTSDAIIAECARRAGASVLLTFNRRHFDPPPEGVKIVEPSA